ncbi:MAG: PQQ-binding-like beta-propeller repeat protein [Gammaproteobacteria bacterium]|nr:PQQ-binding-like beta-propeller repeat protein [Gammaproteobacteria bacterium]MBT5644473.1 PQQ-binding-like beta-propeller repeat protein [Gammaproteobacteria bacterium]MBT5863707.1 PQQ-binding-like beta-propeller repeat protein [Gammaproteobacteria bacterium]MBT6733992.1 PQQ-binding-like beta-propeller repeat protein [Gammaproteobacteria bacterium]
MKKYIIIILSLFISSCSMSNPLGYFDFVANQTQEFQGVKVKLLWSTDIGEERSYKTGTLQPVFSNNVSYTIDSEGRVTAIDLSSGSIKWVYDLELNVSSGLSLHQNMLFFGTSDGKYYGYEIDSLNSSYGLLDRLNITSLLRESLIKPDVFVQLISEVSSTGLGIDNLMFIKLDDGNTVAVNIDNSTIEWQYKGKNVPLSMKGSGSISNLNNNLFIARDDGNLVSLSKDSGKLNWLVSISPKSGRNELESLRDIEMTPYVKDGLVFIGSFQGNLVSVDAFSGNIIWSTPMSVLSNIDIDENYIYVADSYGAIFALDRFSGFIKWKITLVNSLVGTQSFSHDKYLINVSTNGYIMVIDKEKGRLLTSVSLLSDVDNQVRGLLLDKILYITSRNGRLNAIKID